MEHHNDSFMSVQMEPATMCAVYGSVYLVQKKRIPLIGDGKSLIS